MKKVSIEDLGHTYNKIKFHTLLLHQCKHKQKLTKITKQKHYLFPIINLSIFFFFNFLLFSKIFPFFYLQELPSHYINIKKSPYTLYQKSQSQSQSQVLQKNHNHNHNHKFYKNHNHKSCKNHNHKSNSHAITII